MNPPRPQPQPVDQPPPQPVKPPYVLNPPRPQPPTDQPPSPPPRPPIMNPPRPQPVDQTPPPQQQSGSWTVFKSKDGCMAAIKVDCPKGQPGKAMPTCNPPPPFKYACPDGVSLETPITIVTFGDSCAVEREPVKCPPKAICNPPRPHVVPCPKP
jgi:hypothetical protein